MAAAFGEDIVDGMLMAFFNGCNFQAGVSVKSGEDFACLLGVEKGFGGLILEKLDDRDSVGPVTMSA